LWRWRPCKRRRSFWQWELPLLTPASGLMQSELATLRHCMTFGLALRQQRPASQLAIFRSQARIICRMGTTHGFSCSCTSSQLHVCRQLQRNKLVHWQCTSVADGTADVRAVLLPPMQGFVEEDFLVVQQRSGLLKPSYFLLHDRAINSIVLLIRGTQTIKVPSKQVADFVMLAMLLPERQHQHYIAAAFAAHSTAVTAPAATSQVRQKCTGAAVLRRSFACEHSQFRSTLAVQSR
jgi:hypothetical protein